MSTECTRGHSLLGDVHPFELPPATVHYAAERPVRSEHVKLELDLDFQKRRIDGLCTTRVRAIREVKAVTFDAVALEVSEVRVNGHRAEFFSAHDQLRVELGQTLGAGRSVEVSISYHCHPERGLYFIVPDRLHPKRPTQAWTQGQDEDSRAYFPCLDAPAQKSTTEVKATFPSRFTALSNGQVVSDRVHGGRRTTHYRFDYPHSPYLVTLVVGEFEEVSARAGRTKLRYLFPKGRKADGLRCVDKTPAMVRHFETLFKEAYPYRSYAQVFVADFIFGGMENTSATTLTDVLLHDERAHQDYSAEPIVAHELAHQWFGDLLTCRDWPHGWLNEGFASYCEVLWKEHSEGLDEADQARREELDAYLEEASERYARPIVARRFNAPIDLFDRHLYQKGALVLHELRRRLGDELFFESLRHYVAKNRWGTVETVDLARSVEAVTGHNLDRFFDQYVFAPGHPKLKVEVRYEAEAARLRLKVKQEQKGAEGKEAQVYALPLGVEVAHAGKSSSHTLEVSEAEQQFFIPCPKPPVEVLVDPRREVLGTLEVDKASSLWAHELRHAKPARARTEAALALGKDGSRVAVEALSSALREEKFWATGAACARALGQIRSPKAKASLLSGLTTKHPKVRRAVVAALGAFRKDEEVGRALKSVCQRGDKSYFVHAEAARSFGKLRLPDPLRVLTPLLRRPSFQDVVAQGALDGLAEAQEPKAFGVALSQAAPGRPPFVRRAAVLAVARLAEVAEKKKEAVELFSELLRDPEFRVMMTVLAASQVLGDRRMIGPLETTPFKDGRARRAAQETARALREGAAQSKEVQSLREELDKLKGETRELKERVEGLAERSGPKAKGARRR